MVTYTPCMLYRLAKVALLVNRVSLTLHVTKIQINTEKAVQLFVHISHLMSLSEWAKMHLSFAAIP